MTVLSDAPKGNSGGRSVFLIVSPFWLIRNPDSPNFSLEVNSFECELLNFWEHLTPRCLCQAAKCCLLRLRLCKIEFVASPFLHGLPDYRYQTPRTPLVTGSKLFYFFWYKKLSFTYVHLLNVMKTNEQVVEGNKMCILMDILIYMVVTECKCKV